MRAKCLQTKYEVIVYDIIHPKRYNGVETENSGQGSERIKVLKVTLVLDIVEKDQVTFHNQFTQVAF